MKREQVEDKSLDELQDIIRNKYGDYKGTNQIEREISRILQKEFPDRFLNEVRREACKRVLSGQEDRKEISFKEWNINESFNEIFNIWI